LAIDWLRAHAGEEHQSIEATVAFVDVSGFTALTERLAARGKIGAEEVSDLIGGCFTELLDIGYEYGAELLKWGGDAALVMFREPHSVPRACRAAWLMTRAMERVGRVRTSMGRVTLGISVGVHRGRFELYLVGSHHGELVITGPAASITARMEAVAESGEVVVSQRTAESLPPTALGAPQGDGVLLVAAPEADPAPARTAPDVSGVDVSWLLPPPTRAHLLGGGEQAEHRHAAVAFVEFSGVDSLSETEGPEAVTPFLRRIVCRAQLVAADTQVTFHGTDIGPDGGKILLLGGVPVLRGNDEERVLRAARAVVVGGGGQLRVRAGVNAGRVFMHETGPPYRRIHSFSGDAVNLAARVMGKAQAGQVLATAAIIDHTQAAFHTEPLAPFTVKGKREPVEAFAVGDAVGTRGEADGDHVPFVGRRPELDRLCQAADGASAGSGRIVDIVGQPGLGKSRLVSEAAARWTLRTFRLACEEYGRSTPYLPFRWLLRSVLGLDEEAAAPVVAARLRAAVADQTPELVPWLPLLGDVLDVAVPATAEVEALEPRFLRRRLEEAVIEMLSAFLAGPTAVVFEDAHEMDEASVDLLGRLARVVGERPWLVVLARRGDGHPPVSPQLPGVETVSLAALDPASAADLFSAAAADVALAARDRASLIERAAGNPLFLRELAVAIRHAGSVDDIPTALEQLLAAQVDRLVPADRQVLRAAAVLGVRFDRGMLAELLDNPDHADDELWGRLGAYLDHEGGGHIRFASAVARDAAYEGLSFKRRRTLHGRALEAIERRTPAPDDHADLLSLHALHAERFTAAWHYSRVAGERAAALYANADAAVFYRRALEAARRLRPTERPELASVAEALGDVAELAGEYASAQGAYGQARRLQTTNVDRARLLRKTGIVHERYGRYREALRCYTRGRRLVNGDRRQAPGEPAAVESAELAVAYAGVRFRQGRYRECIRWAHTAEREADSAAHRAGLAHALYLEDMALFDLSEPSGEQGRRALAIFEELGDLVGQGNVLNNMGIDAYYQGRWDRALASYERSRAVRHKAGDVIGVATQENNIGEILSDQGRYDDARRLFESAREEWRAADYSVGVALVTSNLGRLAVRSGDLEEGTDRLGDALERFEAIGATAYVAETEARLAEGLVFARRTAEAEATLRRLRERIAALDGADLLTAAALRLSGIVCAQGGDPGASLALLDESVDRAQAVGGAFELAQSLAARAVVGARLPSPDATAATRPTADARAARALFADLGVVDVPITAITDRWPGDTPAPVSSEAGSPAVEIHSRRNEGSREV
jgi:class 3 adenylate cyclase/tetratricopeptide (TPR) repeat protein